MNQLPAPGQTDVGRAWDAGNSAGGGFGGHDLSGLGGIASGLYGLLSGGPDWSNPADAANPYLNRIPGQTGKYFNPYIQAGQGAMGILQGQYGNLLNDPSGMLSKFGQNFQQDPGYQWNLKQGEQGITNAAAAGGMAGTPAHQQQAGNLAENMANQQYQQYLSNVMGLYGQGLQGEQGINQMGYNASSSQAQALAQALMAQANAAYGGANQQNQYNEQQYENKGNAWGSLFGGLGDIAGEFIRR